MQQGQGGLGAQLAQLQKSIQSRDKRMNRDPGPGHGGHDQAYDDERPAQRRKRLAPSQATQAAHEAVLAAAALSGPALQRCELCQATFTSEAAYQQHLHGPVHKKAVAKAAEQAANRLPNEQAQAAMAAAAWQDNSGRRQGGGAGASAAAAQGRGWTDTTAQQQQGRQQHRQQGQQQQQQQRGPAKPQLTHEQLLQQMKQSNEPLSINGWVPPSILNVQAAAPSATAAHEPAQATAAAHTSAKGTADAPSSSSEDEAGLGLGDYGSSSDEEEGGGAGQQKEATAGAAVPVPGKGSRAVAAGGDESGSGDEDDSSDDNSSGGGAKPATTSFF